MKKYFINLKPTRIPVPNNKLIEEHMGNASNGQQAFSLAHMVAPPGWEEPFQCPEFDEITIVVRGRKQFEIDGETVILLAGQSIHIQAGARVRYSNPFGTECEYWALCMPAFSMELVNREDA